MKIVIAGAGIMGLACAWRLASRGAHVEVVDPREPGHGATLASLGALWPASPLARGPLQMLHRESLWQFEAFAKTLSEESGLPLPFQRRGRLEILNSVKANARAKEEASAAKKEWPAFGGSLPTMEVVDYPAAKQINPGAAPFKFGALLCRATGQVSVPEYVAALYKACLGRGVKFHIGTPVVDLSRSGERITGVRTSNASLSADAVVLATGAWTSKLTQGLAVPAVTPAKGQGLALAMPSSPPLTTILKSGKFYLIPWKDEILVGSTTEPDAGFDESPTPAAREKLCSGAAELIPELAGAKILRHWAGLRPESADDLPIMGPVPGAPGLFLCAGHYKTGIGLAPRVSQLLTTCIIENTLPPTLRDFLPNRPQG